MNTACELIFDIERMGNSGKRGLGAFPQNLLEFANLCNMVDSGGCCWGKFSALCSKGWGGGGGRATLSIAPPPPNHHNDTIVSMEKGEVIALTLLDLPAAFDPIAIQGLCGTFYQLLLPITASAATFIISSSPFTAFSSLFNTSPSPFSTHA